MVGRHAGAALSRRGRRVSGSLRVPTDGRRAAVISSFTSGIRTPNALACRHHLRMRGFGKRPTQAATVE